MRILFCVSADVDNVNAQGLNAREIALRLDPQCFVSTFFVWRQPDSRLLGRSSIRFIHVPARFGSVSIAAQMIWGDHDLIFYPPITKSTEWYLDFRTLGKRKRMIMPIEGPVAYIKKENPTGYARFRRVFAASDLVMPLSEFVAAELQHETGIAPSSIVPVGVDTCFFKPVARQSHGPVRVLFVGRLIERKGPQLVVQAAKHFPDVQFQLVGSAYDPSDMAFAESLKSQVRNENCRNVEFLGSLSRTDLRTVLGKADILLHPSRIDGIPKVTLEAAATGMPCVVFDDYHTPSVVDGVTGYQVRTFDEMLERLKLLIENRALRLEMGEAAVEHARQFDWDIVVRQWQDVFEEVALAHS